MSGGIVLHPRDEPIDYQRIRSQTRRGFGLSITSNRGAILHPPDSIIKKLNSSVQNYEPLVVETRESFETWIAPTIFVPKFPAFIYRPLMCGLRMSGTSCLNPACNDAVRDGFLLCEEHFGQTRRVR